jgi:hypothetical protein
MDWVLAGLILSVVVVVSYAVGYVMTDSSWLSTREKLNDQNTSLQKKQIELEMEKLKVYSKASV